MKAMHIRPLQPRGLNRKEAASYIGCCSSKFDEMVKDGRMPSPREIDRRKVWDIKELDESFEELPRDGKCETNEWD